MKVARLVEEIANQPRPIDESFSDYVCDAVHSLQLTLHFEQLRFDQWPSLFRGDLVPHNDVHDPRFIFERHERNAFGAAGMLAHEHEPRDAHRGAMRSLLQIDGAQEVAARKAFAQKLQRMRAERKS